MTGTLSPTAVRPSAPALPPTEGEAPGFLETMQAGFRTAEDDQYIEQQRRLGQRYNDLLSTLHDLGVDTSRDGPLYHYEASPLQGKLAPQRVPDRDAIMAEVQRQRQQWPDRFGTVGKTREEFERQVATRFGGRGRDMEVLRRGSGIAGTWGGLASGMTDPVNIATLPLGAGQASLLRTVLVEGLIGAGTEVANLPGTKAARDMMGEDFTAADAAKQVLLSGGASAVLGGGVRGLELAGPKAGAAVDALQGRLERFVADNWERLPEAVRARMVKGATIADADLPDVAEALIGRGNMTADEVAAVDGLRREAQIAAGSPFKPGAAGESLHAQMIDERLAMLLQPVERQPYRATLPTARADLNAGTSLSSAAPVGGEFGARAAVKARIARAESGGTANPDLAKNPLSSARGRYQFVDGTWLRYYKRRFGDQGLTDAQILAKRSDGRLQETLMDDLTADNAAFLRRVGEAETAGNLYLTHFAGQGGAGKLFRADAEALAADVLGADVARANPWMRGMTVGDVIAWAHRKMNEPAPRRAGARAELDGAEPFDRVAAIQSEMDRVAAEADAARGVRDAAAEQRIADAIEADVVPVDVRDGEVVPVTAPRPREAAADGFTDRELALIPPLRDEIAGTARLSDIKGLATRLDASEAEVRRALERIAATEKELLVRRKDGSFRRVPTDRKPVDAFKYLARKGGLADDEGHDLREIFGVDAATSRKDAVTGKRVKATRRQSRHVPGVGPLIRNGGMSIDDAGEALFAGGYLRGAEGGRPTTAETIAYLEQGMVGNDALSRLVPMDRLSDIDAYIPPETLADMRAHMHEWANYQDAALEPDDIDALARLMLRPDIENEDQALAALVNEAVVDALDDMRYESGDYDDAFARYLDSVEPDSRGERFQADAGNASEGGAGGAFDEPVDVEAEGGRTGWDGANDGLTVELSDSLTHDLDALHGVADDGAPDPVGFYLDENGDARSWADIAAELAADEADIEAIKKCL